MMVVTVIIAPLMLLFGLAVAREKRKEGRREKSVFERNVGTAWVVHIM